ncbi:MAG: FG-GAP-like repeat-containing protein [Bacteroidia bacterium]
MKKIKLFFIALISFFEPFHSFSQNFSPALSIPVTVSGVPLVNPWAGGMDSPQFSAIDLNLDGIKDLFVFDRQGNRSTTYINNGAPNSVDYHYAPQFISKFPSLHDWALLVDYNCDGKEDIFTYSYMGGMSVYKNISSTSLQFVLEYPLVYSSYFGFQANLFVPSVDLPALIDVDNDGDMDVLVRTISGDYVEYHQNFAMDSLGVCDSLLFYMNQNCWGNFLFGGFPCNSATLNAGCRIGNINHENDISNSVLCTAHAMLAFDYDYDGDKDLLNGDIACNYLLFLENGGTPWGALMTAQDDSFPSYNIPVYLNLLPAPFYFDADNDNKKDLIVSPGMSNASENIFNTLFYKNITGFPADSFNLVNKNVFTKEMLEVGTGANVSFFDVDNDGLQDILIGNYRRKSFYPNPDSSFIYYFRNNGTATNPSFEFVTDNFFNTATSNNFNLSPAFGDLDGDGDADMLVGMDVGTFSYYTNTAGAGNPCNFVFTTNNYQSINVGPYSTPILFDMNQDGKIDLISGKKNGKINYYQNTGTASVPVFSLVSTFLGGVNVTDTLTDIYGYSYPFMFYNNGNMEMLVGSERGWIYHYGNITGNLSGTFTLIDSIYGNINEKWFATVSGTDIDGDGLMDLLIGNRAGGVTLYSQLPTSINEPVSKQKQTKVYPNPVSNQLHIEFENEAEQIIIYNAVGSTIKNISPHEKQLLTVETNYWNAGLYFVKIVFRNGEMLSAKFMKE